MSELSKSEEILLTEWKEVRETLRYFGNKRFAQLTVFLAAEGGIAAAFVAPIAWRYHILFQVVGVILACAFFVMEKSSVKYWEGFAARGKQIEAQVKELELMTKHRWNEKGIWSATKAAYVIYVGTALLWFSSLWWWTPKPAEPNAQVSQSQNMHH